MKQNTISYPLALVILVLTMVLAGCSDINKIHQEWLDRGEKIYVGKLDSIIARSGIGKIQLEGDTRYMRTATTCEVRYGDCTDIFNLEDIIGNDGRVRILIEPLEEGSHYFYVTTHDSEGNSSVVTEVFGEVYGDEYRMVQRPKRINRMIPSINNMTIEWSSNPKTVKLDLEYETVNGIEKISFDGDVTTTTIKSNWKRGGYIKATTWIMPDENALESIDLLPVEETFPSIVEYEVPKTTFTEVKLPTDIDGMGYSGIGPKGMWDGIDGNDPTKRYHSKDQEGVPHHLTFDMGVYADLSKVKIWGSSDNSFWNPKRVQLWGRETLDGADTSLPSDDPGWEDEAKEKGWKLIIDFINDDRIVNEHTIIKTNPLKVRYIRYRVLEIVGAPNDPTYVTSGKDRYGLCQEITFWANDIQPL